MPRFLNVTCVTALMALVASGPLEAQLGGRPAEQWALVLESGRRLGSLEIENVVSLIGIEEGQVVADLGAGTGVFSVPLARATGTTGTVLAVEVDQGFLPMIDEKARQAGLENVQSVLGEFTDPNLPRHDVDVAFFHDVLHHIDERQSYLLAVASYMAPGSRMVVVDYDMNQPGVPHGNQPEMLISPQQVAEWMANAGFVVSREVDLFEEKFFVIYTKVD